MDGSTIPTQSHFSFSHKSVNSNTKFFGNPIMSLNCRNSVDSIPKAHSTRKKGAIIAFLANIPLQDIYLAATWSLVHTFTNCYCIDVQMNKEPQVGQKVLKRLFTNSSSSSSQPTTRLANRYKINAQHVNP